MIAQDIEKVFPTAVMNDRNTGYKKVDYAVLVAPLIEAVKSLYYRIVGVESDLAEQKRQIANRFSQSR